MKELGPENKEVDWRQARFESIWGNRDAGHSSYFLLDVSEIYVFLIFTCIY